ncbi:TspO/MBR family protein [Sphingobium algorifonticola]|uniref:Tryptophan-rich sensory protein n=1 Tax=Sphingobium algorifonticola TaxID=2008318 RepID=A0A437J5X4_9SPHN|nr:TspO/MBR family protein [Sphingobium algorifonticola]RVT40350.1 tryptophan-rich sensory protein [Sphingobium algorifonticola]
MGVAIVLLVGGGLATPIGTWYRDLRKPGLQPPNWLFGPAWTIILGLSAWSASIAWESTADAATRRAIIIVFAVNAVCHALWSPLFFKARRPDWALVEVVFLWVSIVLLMVVLGPISAKAALLNLPYLLWVSFASWLNWRIVVLNGPFGAQRA